MSRVCVAWYRAACLGGSQGEETSDTQKDLLRAIYASEARAPFMYFALSLHQLGMIYKLQTYNWWHADVSYFCEHEAGGKLESNSCYSRCSGEVLDTLDDSPKTIDNQGRGHHPRPSS